jgi:hypothetical protein
MVKAMLVAKRRSARRYTMAVGIAVSFRERWIWAGVKPYGRQ